VLDGRKAPTLCDDMERLRPNRRPVVRVSGETLRAVVAALELREQRELLRSRDTRARFLVLATTGRRPCEVMRARPEDVNLEARVST
jgi:integrase